jgi:UDP-4-amino-4,6-dideoxy-N-acetyl-beta-L-altrosamine transaminase
MDLIPYSCQDINSDDIGAVNKVLSSRFITQGPAVEKFEAAFAAYHKVKHAVAVSSATAGLHIGCLALRVGLGSRVWTSPNSFLASANCALYCGATIDFVDIDPITKNISLPALKEKLEQAERNGNIPHLLIPVDFAGLPCDLKEIRELADHYGFRILEDASHATGASYLGYPIGSKWADLTVFSFHAVKIITTAEGGIVTTQDEELARRLRLLRSHGMTRQASEMDSPSEGPWFYQQLELGFNYRLTDLQAALGLSQMDRLESMQAARHNLFLRYNELLDSFPLRLPKYPPDRISAHHLYPIEINAGYTRTTRAKVFGAMRAAKIGVNVHYIPIHTQPYFQRMGFKIGDFPFAEAYYSHALSLPLFPSMTFEQQDQVVATLRQALG